MIKYIKSLIRSRAPKQEQIKGKFEIISDKPYITIKMNRAFFFLVARCIVVGQSVIRKSKTSKTKISQRNVDYMWALHYEAVRMKENKTANEK